MTEKPLQTHAVILAGGRGTRFWPRSRTRTPKQLLNIIGKTTMLEQTVARLQILVPAKNTWTVTNAEQAAALRKQLLAPARKRVLTEPVGRNTAAAIAQPDRFRSIVTAALHLARDSSRMVVLGIPPTRPETGYGYIERMGESMDAEGFPVFAVRRFTEKPELAAAKEYLATGLYQWNAGMFFWRVCTYLDALKSYLPKTHQLLELLASHIGKRSYEANLDKVYPKLENISVDYAIMEPATRETGDARVVVIPADIGWSDIGSWSAVYELLAKHPGENILNGPGQSLDAEGNFLWSPGKFVAAIGVRDLVVVDTPDALLICPRERAQDVGKIVKALEERKHKKLL